MPSSAYSLRAHAIESLVHIKRPDVPWRVVVRNTAAVALPLAIGLATGHPQAGLGVAAGALNTMFSDQPGPYRQRTRQLLLASLVAGIASLLGFLIGGHLLPILLATAAFGFFGGLLVVFGTDTARVGMTSMILLVITAATPLPLTQAASASALIVCGGLLLTLFSLAAWPLQRYWPERQALASVYAGLAALATQPSQDNADAPALTDAMTTLQQTLLGRHRSHGRAMEAFGVLLELAERMRLEFVAMNELDADNDVYRKFREQAAEVLSGIATALEEGATPTQAARSLQWVQARETEIDGSQHSAGMNRHVHALTGQLSAAVRNADWAGSRGEWRARAAETQLPKALRSSSGVATLRANLTVQSVAFRHALRTAACLSAALWISRRLDLPHGYWLPMTAAIVLRPDFAATFNFGLLRMLGTVAGLVVTTVLLHVTPDQPWAHLLLLAILCMTFRYLASAHYGIAVAALTGTVVILLSFDGVNSGVAVMDRVINTTLGCSMALLAYVAWPTWERGRARAALARMLEGYADYLAALAQPAQRTAHRETRTAARTRRSNAQASIERMRAEPATPPELLKMARALFANGNRLARTAMALEALIDDNDALPEQVETGNFIELVANTLRAIADALREQRTPTDLPDLRALQQTLVVLLLMSENRAGADLLTRISDRLVDNVNTLAHVVQQSVTTSDGQRSRSRPGKPTQAT